MAESLGIHMDVDPEHSLYGTTLIGEVLLYAALKPVEGPHTDDKLRTPKIVDYWFKALSLARVFTLLSALQLIDPPVTQRKVSEMAI